MSTWLNAQSISERLQALRQNPAALNYFNQEKAQRRLAAWKDIPAFQDEELFKRRVELDGCSMEEFIQILGTPSEKLFENRESPHWLNQVLAAESFAGGPHSLALEDAVTRGMLPPFIPLIRFYAQDLHSFLEKRQELLQWMRLTANQALDLFLNPVIGRIEYLTRRAIVLEINVQRMLGTLEGETAEARFSSFAKKMLSSIDRLAFLEKYSVLTRSMQLTLELWVEASREFIERLRTDAAEIGNAFGILEDDSLAKFEPGAGDIHCRGRSVVILTFQSGKKVLYKPRDLSIDQNFQDLLRWCNEHGLNPPLKTILVLPRDHYGWVEFIQNFPCESDDDLALFYQRLGVWLCLLHSLVTVDMHFENMVAAGADPVIVDLETLFHGEGIVSNTFLWASDLDAQKIRNSVMGVGLLPAPVVSEGNQTFDVSAIGASVGQQAPYKVTLLQNQGKDDVHIAHVPGWIPSVHSRPSEGENTKVSAQDILSGFESCYKFLLKHKNELLAESGPIAAFEKNSRRLIIRNTRFYGGLSIDAGHPDLLKDDLDRAWHWDNLWNEISFRPIIERFIASEMTQVFQGDIPFFTIGLDGVDAMGADGARINDVIPESGLALARKRILDLSAEGLEQQSWFIRASLGYLDGYARKAPKSVSDKIKTSCGNDPYLAAAREVGEQVLSELTHFEETASCIDVACITGENEGAPGAYSIAPAGVELYDGLGGIALFLAYLARESGEDCYRKGAEALLKNIQMIMAKRVHKWSRMSGFLGLGSLVYVYSHLGVLWNREDLLNEAKVFAEDIPHALEHDDTFDILTGSAGCLLCLLSLERVSPQSGCLNLAESCADHLLDCARCGLSKEALHKQGGHEHSESEVHEHSHEHPHGAHEQEDPHEQHERKHTYEPAYVRNHDHLLVPARSPEREHLHQNAHWDKMAVKRGFSHGLSGVAFALHELSCRTKQEHYAEAALEAVEVERAFLAGGQWTDSHLIDGRPQLSWCHGASGIALSRLGIYRQRKNQQLKIDIEQCLNECSQHYWMNSQCLCHGSLGNLEPLLIASHEFPEFGDWSDLINRAAKGVLAEIETKGWKSILPNQTLGNGLMTGISGIGFAFLRLRNPEGLPSILSLEAPRT